MAKNKKSSNAQQPISPKKYIIEAARKVPVYECLINEGWQEQGMAQVMVTRRKQHGNFIVGNYVLDVFCLGLKNTVYYHNMSDYDYQEHKDTVEAKTAMNWAKIEPNFCFNLIYGAIEYAEDLGFKPNQDFDVTEYILDDVESIEFEEIEFGKDGKPFYISGPYDDPNRIINTLKRSVGEGNFEVLLMGGSMGQNLSYMDRRSANHFEDEEDEFIDEAPSINMMLDFKEEITNPEEIIEAFVKKHKSVVNLAIDPTLPFIRFYPNEEEMEQKFVDKDMIKAITSFFNDHYLKNDCVDIHVHINAQSLNHRGDELFDGIFDVDFADLKAENKNLDSFLAHFPQLDKDKGISNCIKNNHLFTYIEKTYEVLKNMPLQDNYIMKLYVMLAEEEDDAPMRFIITLCIQDKSYDDE
jgi:phage pi2 protein 07